MKLLSQFDHYDEGPDRDDKAIPCACGGYCDREDATAEEDKAAGGCGRIGCCTAAFVCRVCGERWVALLPAPEME